MVKFDANGNPYNAYTAPILGEGKQFVNGQVQALPGYVASQNAIQGASADIKSQHEIVDLPVGNQTIKVRADIAQKVMGAGLSPSQALYAVHLPAEQLDAFIATAKGSNNGQGVTAPVGGAPSYAATPPQGQQSAPMSPSTGAIAPSFGGGGGFGMTANPIATAGATAEATQRGDAYGKQSQAIDDAAAAAQNTLGRTAEVRNLLTSFKPGALTPLRADAGAIAQATGFSPDVVNMIAGGSPGAIQATVKANIDGAFDSTKAALAGANGGSGRITQAEILLKAKTQPGVALTPEANNILLDVQEGMANRAMDMQGAKEAWLSDPRHGGSMAGFLYSFNRQHPVDSYIPSAEKLQATLFPQGAAASAPNVVVTPDGKSRAFPSAQAATAFKKQYGLQ